MVDPPISHTPDGTGPGRVSWEPSELLTNYGRLLILYTDELRKVEFNPHQSIPSLIVKSFSFSFLKRAWKHTVPFLKVPNTLRQDLAGGRIILKELERLDDQTLRSVAECNRINYRRLLQRSAFGFLPKITGTVVLVLGAAKIMKETIGFDFPVLPSVVWDALLVGTIGLVLGSVGNLVFALPMLGLVRALDDLIAITVAFRGTRE